ncbi:MAG: hypothetical protein NVSMB17_01390 [Candidatus Dormibacteria bacterium]
MVRDPRLQWTILLGIGAPALLAYAFAFLVSPFASPAGGRNDLDVYLRAAADMAGGLSPYREFAVVTRHVDPTLTGGYIYPPGLAWYLQPLTAVPRGVAHAIVAVLLQLLLLVAGGLVIRALAPVPGRMVALLALMALLFFPLWQNLAYQQVNLLLLALSSVWLWAWARAPGDGGVAGAVGGAATGLAVGLKLIQGPGLALVLGRRRWSMLVPAVGGIGVIALAGYPWLGEYISTVLPSVGRGSGWVLNQAPAALAARLIHPVSFYRTTPDTGQEVAVTAAALGVLVVAMTLAVLRRPPVSRDQRCLEVALVVAAAPVFLPLTWDTHLVLMLLPLAVLGGVCVRRGDRPGVLMACLAWALMGPLHLLYLLVFGSLLRGSDLTLALSTGHPGTAVDLVLRGGAEMGAVGIVLLWMACLRAYSAPYA